MARETSTSEMTELDSDGSSCGERSDARKRVRIDTDSTGPKKRRKQTTPVRFSSSLTTGVHEESNDDEEDDGDEDSEGKLSSQSPIPRRSSIRDENLDNEFHCQYCNQFFDSNETLNVHLDNEHGTANRTVRQHENSSPNSAIKATPPRQTEQTELPVTLFSARNLATNWLGTGQRVQTQSQSHVQMQSQNEDLWSGPASQIAAALPNHLQAFSGFPSALAQYLPLPAFPLADSAGHMTRPSIGPAPVRIFNPDAYCDLCNKEFCNKYFLKTHKANKHGIYVDSPGPSGLDNNAPGAVYPGNVLGSVVKLEPLAAPTTPPTPSVACDLCQKRFRNEESVRKHKQKVHTELLDQSLDPQINLSLNEEEREMTRDSPGGMETLFKQEYGVEQEDATYVPAPRHLSPRSIQQARDAGFNADRLRRLGVINPDAFCEICCKEYCNKYFLRTHKMKRHGVVVQDNEKSPSTPGSAASWHQVQTSPLNLIVTESISSTESNERPGDDYECKPCGIRFQTIGLYRAHCRKMHETEEQRSPKQEYNLETPDQRNDSISEDLQKLQTMLLQLNGLKSSKESSCTICGKECETRKGLHVHMVTEHAVGVVGEDSASSPLDKSPLTVAAAAFCALCGKDYPSQDALGRHIAEEHQSAVSSSAPHTPSTAVVTAATINSNSTSQTPTSERKVTSMTPTSSYCEICNKELCNKYFMKTHMQRMHGIEIENGAQIGGVICNICNKELCSKYFLRVHKHNTHGIVDENTPSSTKQETHETTNTDDTALKPEQLGDLSHRYFTHFTEVCPICSRRFRSIKWLKAHLMGDHGKIGIDKWREMEQQYQAAPRTTNRAFNTSKTAQISNLKIPNGFETSQSIKSTDYAGLGNQVLSNLLGTSSEDHQSKSYRCSYCSFTTTVLPFLFLHERSHVNSNENAEGEKSLQCPICSQGFHQPEMLHQHLLTAHQFPTLLSHFQPPVLNHLGLDAERSSEPREKFDSEIKEERAEDSPRVTGNHTIPESIRSQRQDDTAVQVTPQGVYKCAQCGYATTNLNRIKRHVRKDHKAIGDPTDSVIAELSKTLKDVANRHKMPACYAMPQDMNSNADKTIMQPFLLEEQDVMQAGEESSSEKRFVPALVYLPVKSRIGNALTASFTLSPA
ncbi:uncharacterized protein LOC128873851 [Hylaeus volcanicus]|uniref:uncharacterized protein LOC128873851 n=1 Tax=Hylaeus volcanicus TaxID=313075 RepID=UPI0023B81BBF|nr:uncharacterized protein LOC128873851 [Hylaeus volcanicus]